MAPFNTAPLVSALIKILRPLIRILLRNGMSYVTFANIAKWVFVDTAAREFGIAGKKQSVSRISVLTGLSRKEVKKTKEAEQPPEGEMDEQYNRAARVIAAWRRELLYNDREGNPKMLPVTGDDPSFSELVRQFSGDLPVRAVLDELINSGNVVMTEDNRVRLLVRAYVPGNDDNAKLQILGTDVALLIKTIDHNMQAVPPARWYQRKVLYDNLPREVLPFFRDVSAESAQHTLEHLDKWLAENDRDNNPDVEGTGRYSSGLGIFYFEELFDDEN